MLRRHVTTCGGFSIDQYRARWNLPAQHPMTAPSYSEGGGRYSNRRDQNRVALAMESAEKRLRGACFLLSSGFRREPNR
jgi:predicted transcriptional regulator